jgi:hypothetical protein
MLKDTFIFTPPMLTLVKQTARKFPPRTKFRSLFGATDIVSERDEFRIDKDGDVYILGTSGEFRLIYNGSYWADIL